MKIFWVKPKNILIIVIILMMLLIGLKYAGSYMQRTMYPIKHNEYIEEYAYEYNLDPWLVVSVFGWRVNLMKKQHRAKMLEVLCKLHQKRGNGFLNR